MTLQNKGFLQTSNTKQDHQHNADEFPHAQSNGTFFKSVGKRGRLNSFKARVQAV